MPKNPQSQNVSQPSRREFLKRSGAVAAGATLGGLALSRSAHAAGSDVLRIGLSGCGGRGTGAALNALGADPNTKLVAMADAFADRLQTSLDGLKKRASDRVAVDQEHCFTGFDACRKMLDSGVDVVLLCEPPHFRPAHLKAAIDAGKHVFCEKPVAVDAPGVRSVLATVEEAQNKGLNLVSGLCWRYDPAVRATMQRVLDGAIGDIVAIQETYNTGTLWYRGHEPDWTEMQYQVRNWYYYTWLSGDHNVEQHIHSLDKALWAMHDQPPARAWGLGGRQVRTDPKWGNIFDHHAVVYEYEGDVPVYSHCRQMASCFNQVIDVIFGTKGRAYLPSRCRIEGENPWQYDGPKENMYDVEHQALFGAIRSGKPINNGLYMAHSTMMAILGRMVTYTGQQITWDEAINSKEDLSPAAYTWATEPPILPGPDGNYPVAIPGVTRLV